MARIHDKDVKFFYDHAGFSYPIGASLKRQETERIRGARRLVDAESWAAREHVSFNWQVSDEDSSSFSDETPAWSLWDCIAYSENGEVIGSLGSVDFGRDGEPWGDPYKRVVEAQIALEAMP